MVSVIVPVYNVKKYVAKCIDSILGQSYSDLEIILVDDGSTDGSGEICDQYAKQEERIRVIHQKNGGLSEARNTGIKAANGEYLTFIDSDDFIHRNMLRILWENIKEEEAQVSVCGFQYVYEDEIVNDKETEKDRIVYHRIEAVKTIVKDQNKNMIVTWGKLYQKELWKEIRFPAGKYHEDEFTTYQVLDLAEKTVVTKAELYYYLQRNASIMGNEYNIKRLDKLNGLKESIAYFKKKNNSEMYHLAQYRYLFQIQVSYYRCFYEMKENKQVLKALEQEYKKEYLEADISECPEISWKKTCLLAFFFRAKRVYCFLVRIYTKINKNLSD